MIPLACALLSFALIACAGGTAGETAFTAAQGPADTALPYQAVFAVNENADERLVSAAQSFCGRTAEFSRGGAIFSLSMSKNALQDLKTGKADVILLESAEIDAFAPASEAFRYKSYEHFAMTANSDAALRILSDAVDANIFAGFYAGSNVLLSRGTLDSKFRPLSRDNAADAQDPQTIPVTARSDSTARAFALLKADASVAKELDARIRACSLPNSVVEFSHSELDSPALLAALRKSAAESSPTSESDGDSEDTEPVPTGSEPFVATQAFTGIKPVWLVFAKPSYEKLSQTNRAAAAEAAAYMVSDIDDVYLQYEREMLRLLAEEDIAVSRDFAATRVLALRHADEQDAQLTAAERKLREALAKIQ